jgi:peptidoglycan/xylan/chitin deacetylase (PgdA/CDA1 family)
MRLFRPWLVSKCLYPEGLFRIKTEEKILYLTFDDGPDPGSTPALLKILEKNHVKALFFCRGEAAEKFPDIIDAIRNGGHIIGNHGYSHLDGWKTCAEKYCDDIKNAARVTSDRYFRPPYGHLTISQYLEIRKTFKIIFWDIMAYDFDKSFGTERSLCLLNRKIRPGSIIVLHDTPESACNIFIEDFIMTTVSKGYRFCFPD